MNTPRIFALLIGLWLCGGSAISSAEKLLLSSKLFLEYETPKEILHTEQNLFLKYDKLTISHEVLGSTSLFYDLELKDNLNPFIRSMFRKPSAPLTEELEEMAVALGGAFGVSEDGSNTIKNKLGTAEIFAVYDAKRQRGGVFIIEKLLSHRIDILDSTQEEFTAVLSSIKQLNH